MRGILWGLGGMGKFRILLVMNAGECVLETIKKWGCLLNSYKTISRNDGSGSRLFERILFKRRCEFPCVPVKTFVKSKNGNGLRKAAILSIKKQSKNRLRRFPAEA